jgi:glycosyltransferase involved in cell wall biosynthesis
MSKPIRVLHVVVNMNRGGAETLIMNLYRNIDRSKVQFDFLTCREGTFDEEIINLGGYIYRIPYLNEAGHFKYLGALKEFFSVHSDYRIVHSHMNQMSGFVLRAAKNAGIPVRIAQSHNIGSSGNTLGKIYKWYSGKKIKTTATNLLACSNEAASWLYKDRKDKAVILKNGIEYEKFKFSTVIRANIRDELNISPNSYVIGHIGRFCEQKNHDFLINIFMEFLKTKPQSLLILAGDGPLRKDIEKKVLDLNIEEKVKFLGVRTDINNLIQAFDVFVFPSLYEGLGIVLIEAQASGLTCLTSNNVPKESDMGIGLVKFIPLENANVWVNQILHSPERKKNEDYCIKGIIKNGYDIRKIASWIQVFYIKALR